MRAPAGRIYLYDGEATVTIDEDAATVNIELSTIAAEAVSELLLDNAGTDRGVLALGRAIAEASDDIERGYR